MAALARSGAPPASRTIAGAMSGTSADGVDVAVVRVDGRAPDVAVKLLHLQHRPYPAELRAQVLSMRGGEASANLARLAQLGRAISLTYAAAVNEALVALGMSASELGCVAAHGQTLYHAPPLTIQWLDPALLAAEVGCAVVSDFRRADCAAGGQGAPLVPFADYILFCHATRNRVLLNVGGIANITWLPAAGRMSDVIAFDTGPGNCISDHLAGGVDEGGRLAQSGQVSRPLLRQVLDLPYFTKPPPKSTDGPEMVAAFMRGCEASGPDALPDRLATACALTAASIALGIARFCPGRADEVIASGGGTLNAAITDALRKELGPVPLRTTDELGMPSAAREAVAFALLGAATLDGVPSNVPSVTGARRAIVLGSITPPP